MAETAVEGRVRELESLWAVLNAELQGLSKENERLSRENDRLRDSLSTADKELAALRLRSDDQQKRLDEWDRRFWAVVLLLSGAVVSSAVALVRK